jgi:hypothetical protein
MDTSKTFRRVLLLSSLLVVSSAVAAGVYIQTSKSQKKPKDHSSGYDAATVTEACRRFFLQHLRKVLPNV